MSNDVEIRVTSKDDTRHGFASAKRAAEGLGSAVKGVALAGGALTAGVLTVGLVKATDQFHKSVEAASDLGESINAVQKVFGPASKQVEAWGKANANSFGLSLRAFNELATPLGAGLKNAGLNMKDTSKWTIDLTKRAADMASVFNTDVSDAMEAIQAGLRGESDPLEQFGVGLSAAAVEAEALSETGKKTAKSLTNQETVTARLNLIMKQTKSTQGDFAGTSTGLANSQRIAAARTEELQAAIGQKLIPAALWLTKVKLELATVIAERVVPAIQTVTEWLGPRLAAGAKSSREWFDRNRETINKVSVALRDAGVWVARAVVWFARHLPAALGGTIHAIGNTVHAIGNVIHAFGNIIHAAGNVIHAIDNIAHAFGNVGRAVNGAIDAIRTFLGLNSQWQKSDNFGSQVGTALGGAESRGNARRSGGIIGAAGGGARGGLTWVGEAGPELVRLPYGSTVIPAGQSAGMGGGGAPAQVVVRFESSGSDLDNLLLRWARNAVRIEGGGNVQAAFGRN